jgi:hypothetical protein
MHARVEFALVSAAFAALVCGCATASSPAPPSLVATQPWSDPAKETAILAVVDRFMLAVGNRDGALMAQVLLPDGMGYMQRSTEAGFDRVRPLPHAALLSPPDGADPFIERYWNPEVLIRGGFAQVWAPYELRDNGKVVHCGIDGFQLVDLDGAWRIAHVISTMEPDACDEIRPESVAAMRPRDGWRETPLQ